MLQKIFLMLAMAFTFAMASLPASAAIVLDDVETSLNAAQVSGESVGTLVIGVVAALVVVGLIIGLVKKI